jgi:hypothetical protein
MSKDKYVRIIRDVAKKCRDIASKEIQAQEMG